MNTETEKGMWRLTPGDIDREGLSPLRHTMTNGKTLFLFPDNHIEIVKLDFVFEAGSALQDKKIQSLAAVKMLTSGTSRHTAREIAEFMDFRGIVIEQTNDSVSATMTVYSHSRYLEELLPLLYELITDSVYPDSEFEVFVAKRKQQLQTNMKKTSYRARLAYYEALYGKDNPLGTYAFPEDLDRLTVSDVRRFHDEYLTLSRLSLVMAGNVSDKAVALAGSLFGTAPVAGYQPVTLPEPLSPATGVISVEMPDAVQNSLRVGRILPLAWDGMDYACFMVLTTVLGGYFGSRLMSNIREDKGYTYGINAMTQIYRGSLVFHIITDVASDKADATVAEVFKEVRRLCDEPVSREELELVRNCMLGDFMRSIDGIFERSERFCQLMTAGISERFTDNLMSVLDPEGPDCITSSKLQEQASRFLDPSQLLVVSAGGPIGSRFS